MIKASQIKKVLIMNQREVMMRPRGKRVRRRKRRRSRGLGNWFLPVSALCFLLAVCIMGFKPDASAQGDSTSLAKTAYQPNSSTQTTIAMIAAAVSCFGMYEGNLLYKRTHESA